MREIKFRAWSGEVMIYQNDVQQENYVLGRMETQIRVGNNAIQGIKMLFAIGLLIGFVTTVVLIVSKMKRGNNVRNPN